MGVAVGIGVGCGVGGIAGVAMTVATRDDSAAVWFNRSSSKGSLSPQTKVNAVSQAVVANISLIAGSLSIIPTLVLTNGNSSSSSLMILIFCWSNSLFTSVNNGDSELGANPSGGSTKTMKTETNWFPGLASLHLDPTCLQF